jgi:hypothetical protein
MNKKLKIGLVLTILVGIFGVGGVANAVSSNASLQAQNNATARGPIDPVQTQNKKQLMTLSARKAAAMRLRVTYNAARGKYQAPGQVKKGGV